MHTLLKRTSGTPFAPLATGAWGFFLPFPSQRHCSQSHQNNRLSLIRLCGYCTTAWDSLPLNVKYSTIFGSLLFVYCFKPESSKMWLYSYLHDDVTSWRRITTTRNLYHLFQLVGVLERFVLLWYFGLLSLLSILYSHDGVTSWGYFVACRCAREMSLFFVSMGFGIAEFKDMTVDSDSKHFNAIRIILSRMFRYCNKWLIEPSSEFVGIVWFISIFIFTAAQTK